MSTNVSINFPENIFQRKFEEIENEIVAVNNSPDRPTPHVEVAFFFQSYCIK